MIAAMNWGRRITKAQKGIFPDAKSGNVSAIFK
jgi:hypothetical protein